MRTLGIIGGIGAESTIEYYRLLIAGYRERIADSSYPPLLINSIDVNKCWRWYVLRPSLLEIIAGLWRSRA